MTLFETIVVVALWCWSPQRDSMDVVKSSKCRDEINSCVDLAKKNGDMEVKKCFFERKK